MVDASVGIKLFLEEAFSEQADALFALLAADPPAQIFVPDLFFVECANILWKHARRSYYPVKDAKTAIDRLSLVAVKSIAASELMKAAFGIAIRENITAYDACYVALASRLSVPFITADEKLMHALPKSLYDVRWLGDYAAPFYPTTS